MGLQSRERAEACKDVERRWGTSRACQFAVLQQLLVYSPLFGSTQAIWHLDDGNSVDEGFVVPVVLEGLPLGLVRMRENDSLIGDASDVLGADVIAFLRRRQ